MMRPGLTVAALLGIATGAQASPIGTPQSNAPHGGNGSAIDLPFGHHHDTAPGTVTASADGRVAVTTTPRRHRTQAEWREAYIAKHGHDLVAPAHPGH